MQHKRTKPLETKNFKQMRDELRVQAHLFKGDAKEILKSKEHDAESFLNRYSSAFKYAAKQSAPDLKRAYKHVVRSVKNSYKQFKRTMPS